MAAAPAHQSPLAGQWYPNDGSQLKQLLESAGRISIERNGSFVRGGGRAFIVPHAAPAYSGVVASSVYRHVQATGAERIVLLGFSHRRMLHGIAVPEVEQIETPLGAIPLDRETLAALADHPPFHHVPEALTCDHSVEIQIPFLQTQLPHTRIVPLYVGDLTPEQRRQAAAALRSLMDDRTVLIASSDLTHYGADFRYVPFELDDSTPDRLRKLDMGVLAAAGSLDPELFAGILRRTGATVCGASPIKLLLETLAGMTGAIFQEILDYETSGDLTHDFAHSVSYGAIGYFPASSFELEPKARAELLARARMTLNHYQRTGEYQSPDAPAEPALLQRCRAFVTLFAGEKVRGCIGRFEEPLILADGVPLLAVEASEDARFGAVQPDEDVRIEVHILTPPKRLRDPGQLKVGLDGAYLRAGNHGGLLLPGVAERYGLTHRRFLEELARKANLPDSIYSTDCFELFAFRDQSFQETRGEQQV
jgi:AmmeMemoRadiSam system protein B/AmmeMemoRadiSam system protein A